MTPETSKVTADHLRRAAYLYVRQSTLHQVVENQESTRRQYALRQRAVALGWPDTLMGAAWGGGRRWLTLRSAR